MSDSDNYVKILEKISEVREDTGVLKSEVAHLKESMVETKGKLSEIEERDREQNRLLDEHIAGVETANKRLDNEIKARENQHELIQKQIEHLDDRLKKAEFLPDGLHFLKKSLKWLAAVLLAVATILGLFHKS